MLSSVRTGFVLAAIGLAGLGAGATHGALIDANGFEDYNAGPVAGQGGWSNLNMPGGSSGNVVSVGGGAAAGSVYAGDKALALQDGVTWGTPIIKHAGEGTVKGSLNWVAKVSDIEGGAFYLQLSSSGNEDGNAVNSIGFNSDGTFLVRPSGVGLDAPEYVVDRWYRFDVTFDTDAGTRGQVSIKIFDTTNDQEVYSLENTELRTNYVKGTPISDILIRANNAATGTMHIDNLTVPEPAGGAAMLMGAGALLGMRRR